ncbi:sensor domain-containing diguanylate cyclase [Deinococcus ruber]|uniref:Diguanylate cyclase n=1 Tax=Deinococcus ruber TaxID=1848197 RepID=A0A918CHD5_9DEIO|nr:diguanylate cyclase [Deinococcus ruber]GGR23091.1 diguanylate cyclase [Deinococcus ruber]
MTASPAWPPTCSAPPPRSSILNFVDQHRQWGKAAVGITDTNADRQHSFCAWAILQDTPMVVENAHLDPRFHDNPMVLGDPYIHMYAGAPLTTPSGHRVGTLCVMDTQDHPLTPADLQALQDLADTVVNELEFRLLTRALQWGVGAQAQFTQELSRTLQHAQVLEGVNSLMDLDLDPEHMTMSAAALLGEAIGSDYTGLIVFEDDDLRVEAAYARPGLPDAALAVAAHLPRWPGGITRTLRALSQPRYLEEYPLDPHALPLVVAAGIGQIAWIPLGTRGRITSLLMAVRLQDNAVTQWRGSDRALLESAGRSVRSALDRQVLWTASAAQVRQDPLTGLLNRRAFDDDAQRWHDQGQAFTLGMIDLDGFKAVNDREGHTQGDRVLKVFASTLRAELDDTAQLYRFGGDEFVLLLPACQEDTLLEMVDIAILAARQVAGLGGASVGMAHSGEAVGTALLELADTRMYAVKQRRHALKRLDHPAATHSHPTDGEGRPTLVDAPDHR